MFQLTLKEAQSVRSRSQTVILKRGQYLKYEPYAFTEHGILMLSSVLNSERAVQVNIEIMQAFVRLLGLGQEVGYQSAKRTNDSSPAVHCWDKSRRICSP